MESRISANRDKLSEEYCRTILEPGAGSGDFINAEHRSIMEVVAGVDGQLRPGDAQKLYEMAFFADGPILEIGCLHGKSTTVLALGLRAAGRGWPIVTVDASAEHCAIAEANVQRLVAGTDLRTITGDSRQVVSGLEHRFAFAFVDGNHRYTVVREDLTEVDRKLMPSGFMLLHDYYDSRNHLPEGNPRYGVVRAAHEILMRPMYAFRGRFGCSSLFQKAEGMVALLGVPLSGLRRLWSRMAWKVGDRLANRSSA